MAIRKAVEDPKVTALRETRCLNPHPEQVRDEAFLREEFFDARDAVQVKYEMVRRVADDGVSVTEAASSFGFSRQSYYTASQALSEGGLAALVPAKPGPRGAHKLTDDVLEHLEALRAEQPALRTSDLVRAVADQFGITVHPRSVQRALARREATRSSKSG